MKKRRPQLDRRSWSQWLDQAIFSIAPSWGLSRRNARRKDSLIKAAEGRVRHRFQRAWEAADQDRFRGSKWMASKVSVNSALEDDMETLRERAEDLYRNDCYAASAVNGRVANVVGSGYTFQSLAEDEAVRDEIEAKYKLWSRLENVPSKQRLVQKCKAIYGEAFLELSDVGSAEKPVPLHVQVIHPKRVSTPEGSDIFRLQGGRWRKARLTTQESDRIRLGIRFSARGMPTHYYVRTSEVNDYKDMSWTYYEVPADRMLHGFEKLFPGQIRGVPWMAPSMGALKDIKDFKEANLISEQIAACFSVFVETDLPEDAADGAASDTLSDGTRLEDISPGTVQYTAPGEQVKFADPNRPGGTLGPYLEWHLRTVAAGLNYPYELLVKDYSRTTYSSGRLSLVDGRIQFGIWIQEDLVDIWSEVARRFVTECVIAGEIGVSAVDFESDPEIVWAHKHNPPRWPWIDPDKEVKAEVNAIAAGLATKADCLAARGLDYDEIQMQRTREALDEVDLRAAIQGREEELGILEEPDPAMAEQSFLREVFP